MFGFLVERATNTDVNNRFCLIVIKGDPILIFFKKNELFSRSKHSESKFRKINIKLGLFVHMHVHA